jgi:hypothetical protein
VPFPTKDVAELDGAAEPQGIIEPDGVVEPDAQEGAVFTLTFWSLHSCWASWVVAVKALTTASFDVFLSGKQTCNLVRSACSEYAAGHLVNHSRVAADTGKVSGSTSAQIAAVEAGLLQTCLVCASH